MPTDWRAGDPRLQPLSAYGLSSFTYAAFGALLLTTFRGNFDLPPAISGFGQDAQAGLMLAQSGATFMADVLHLGHNSVWHAIDRWVAIFNTVAVASNMLWISLAGRAYYACTLAVGVSLLHMSRHERVHGTTAGFAFWHAAWHWYFPTSLLLWVGCRQWG